MNRCDVYFGKDLLGSQLCALTTRFRELAAEIAGCPLFVGTIFGVDSPEETLADGSGQCVFVLLDLHRLFLFQTEQGYGSVLTRSIRRFVMDDHRFRGNQMLADAMRNTGYRFLYPLESLNVLPSLWRSAIPQVRVVDFSTCEIDTVEPQEYPRMPAPFEGTPLDAVSVPALELDNSEARPNWRTPATPRTDDLGGLYTGIIRNEYVRFTATSIPVATTRILWNRGKEEALCGGMSTKAKDALLIGRCEAMERFQAAFIPETERLTRARYTDLNGRAIDPALLFFRWGSDGKQRPQDVPMYWTAATHLVHSEQVLVPAQEVWLATAQLRLETLCIRPTTNGCALGNGIAEASLFAILELVERDAYLVMWYLRNVRGKVKLDTIRTEPVKLLLARMRYKFPGYSIHVFDIRSEIPIPAVAAIAVRESGSGPKALHAAAARPQTEQAVFSALKDLALCFDAVGGEHRRRSDWKPPESEDMVNSPEDHRAFHASDENFARLSFLDFESRGDRTPEDIDSASLLAHIARPGLRDAVFEIAGTLERLGLPVFLKDITHGFSRRRGLFCVKAIVPGMFPMWYGKRHLRFALTERLRRLAADRPGKLALLESDINLQVHPFG